MEYAPYGASDKIKLSVQIVQNLVAVPTRSGKTCTERDAIKFMMLCQAKRLNPFEGDAFLIGFDTKNGPSFNLVTAHQAYLKRAELHPEFDGLRSGITVSSDNGPLDIEGEIAPNETELVGAWCAVYFKNRKIPMTKRIPLSRFQRQISQQSEWGGPWKDDPGGMITKCAEADALRSAFPTMLGGLYMRDEVAIDVRPSDQPLLQPGKLVKVATQNEQTNDESAESAMGLAPAPKAEAAPNPSEKSIQEQVAELVIGAGYDFTTLQNWGNESGVIENASTISSFDELSADVCKRLLRAKTGLFNGLKSIKERK